MSRWQKYKVFKLWSRVQLNISSKNENKWQWTHFLRHKRQKTNHKKKKIGLGLQHLKQPYISSTYNQLTELLNNHPLHINIMSPLVIRQMATNSQKKERMKLPLRRAPSCIAYRPTPTPQKFCNCWSCNLEHLPFKIIYGQSVCLLTSFASSWSLFCLICSVCDCLSAWSRALLMFYLNVALYKCSLTLFTYYCK